MNSTPPYPAKPARFPIWLHGCILFVAVFLAFSPSLTFDFINYDDPNFITENPNVNTGLNAANLKWALFSPGEVNLWNPLTSISHQLVVSLFGLNPAWHHAVNVLLHALGAGFLFLLSVKLLKSIGLGYFIALLWAVHPQKVQSVAWIAERKDVLSGALFFASILCFAGWKSRAVKTPALYLGSLFLFIAAAMAKPNVLPLPCLLLALFYLKPGRIIPSALSSLRPLSPFFASAVALAGIVVFFQSQGTLSEVGGGDSPFERLRQVVVCYAFYLVRFALPVPQQLFFTPPGSNLPFILSIAGICLFLTAVIWLGRRDKLIPLGAVIFTLLWLPVSGIIPISNYFVADRYSYLPQLGVIIMVVGIARILSAYSPKPVLLPLALFLLAAGYFALTQRQLPTWKNSETLFHHEMRVNPGEALGYIHYGEVFRKNEPAKAVFYFEIAHEKAPTEGLPLTLMGDTQLRLGRTGDALASFTKATRTSNPVLETWTKLFMLQIDLELIPEAEETVNDGLRRFPEQWPMLMNAANFHLLVKKDAEKALAFFLKAHELRPNEADSIRGCARCHLLLGNGQAAAHFEALLEGK